MRIENFVFYAVCEKNLTEGFNNLSILAFSLSTLFYALLCLYHSPTVMVACYFGKGWTVPFDEWWWWLHCQWKQYLIFSRVVRMACGWRVAWTKLSGWRSVDDVVRMTRCRWRYLDDRAVQLERATVTKNNRHHYGESNRTFSKPHVQTAPHVKIKPHVQTARFGTNSLFVRYENWNMSRFQIISAHYSSAVRLHITAFDV